MKSTIPVTEVQSGTGIFHNENDAEILEFLKNADGVPDRHDKHTCIFPLLSYTDSFDLYLIMHFADPNDSGYRLFYIPGFLDTEEEVNLIPYCNMGGFDRQELAAAIISQANALADALGLKLTMKIRNERDFFGVYSPTPPQSKTVFNKPKLD
jgi:hypothetical protein